MIFEKKGISNRQFAHEQFIEKEQKECDRIGIEDREKHLFDFVITPKLLAANRSLADTADDAVVCA